jgi:hypothetical protein
MKTFAEMGTLPGLPGRTTRWLPPPSWFMEWSRVSKRAASDGRCVSVCVRLVDF